MRGVVFGREQAVTDLRSMVLAAPGIVTVTGMGGVGKSTLVERAADPSWWPAHFSRRIVVELAEVGRADMVLPAIATATGVRGSARESLAERLTTTLTAGGPQLLVLDNFEHVLAAAADVARLVERGPELSIVVTSRTPLRVRGERVLDLGPLPLATAAEMFVAVATRHDPGRHGAGHEAAIASICRQVDGVPLAIELAAARTATIGPAEIEALLSAGAHLAVLRDGPRDLPSRQRDLEATIAWSHQLLSPGAQRMLARLSELCAPFELDAVTAIVGEPVADCLDRLGALVDAHLVLTEETDGRRRYRLPVPIREYGMARLAEDPVEAQVVAAAYGEHVSSTARAVMVDLDGADSARGLARLAASEADLVHTLELALAAGDAAIAAAVAPALSALWLARGVSPTMRPLLAAAVELADRGDVPDADRAHVRGWLAMLDAEALVDGLDPARVEKALLQAADLARRSGDLDVRLRTLLFVTLAARTVNNFDSAIAAADEGAALAEAEQRLSWCGRFEAEAGMTLQKLGDDRPAADLGVRALRHGRAADDVGVIVRAVAVLRPPGPPPRTPPVTCPTLDEALAMAIAAGDVTASRYLYPMAAVDALYRDRPRLAAQRCADGLDEAIRSGSLDYGRINVLVLSAVAIAEREMELAAELQGTMSAEWPRLRLGLAMVTQRSGTWLLDSLRGQMDPATYERASERGAARPAAALTWAHEHAVRLAAGRKPGELLTPRELTVLQLVADGLSNRELAARLGITAKTAMHHTSAIYRKLGVDGRIAAVAVAYREGLIAQD